LAGHKIRAASCRETAHVLVSLFRLEDLTVFQMHIYRSAGKSLARPGRKQATAPEDFEFHISYL